MQETKNNSLDMLFYAIRKWRKIIGFAIVCALIVGLVAAAVRYIYINDEEKVELWQTEYEVALGAYHAAINDLDRQISENERAASQTQLKIEKLAITKGDYEGRLEDLAAKIVYYEALIEDYQANIEELRLERDKLEYYLKYRQEQNENSLLMKIDPYNVNVYEIFIRVDSGYEIIPDSTYQNIDPTNEIINTYRLMVNNTDFYNKMISDLNLGTEVRYLTEIISVSLYNTNSIRLKVISSNATLSQVICEYAANTILNNHAHVSKSIADHDLTKFNTLSYSIVDLDTYSKQYKFIEEAIDYEASIREVDVTILGTEASIRDMYTDIREFRQEMDDINLAINELPLVAQTFENEISGYRDANYALRTEKLELMSKPEPEYLGYTMLSILTGFIKFAIIGGIIGAVIAAVYHAMVGILSEKVYSSGQLCNAVCCKFFGYWLENGKKRLSFIDRRIDRMAGCTAKGMTPQVSRDLVLSNVAVACGKSGKLLLCGGADVKITAGIAEALKEQLPDVEIIFGGTVGFDPAVVRGMAECDAVVMIEQLDKSVLSAAVQLTARAKSMNKPVLGVITTR